MNKATVEIDATRAKIKRNIDLAELVGSLAVAATLKSLERYYAKWGYLTGAQHMLLESKEKTLLSWEKEANSPLIAESSWKWEICRDYYLLYYCNHYKIGRILQRVIERATPLPTEAELGIISGNKYSQKLIDSYASDPKYLDGSLVMLRTSASIAMSRNRPWFKSGLLDDYNKRIDGLQLVYFEPVSLGCDHIHGISRPEATFAPLLVLSSNEIYPFSPAKGTKVYKLLFPSGNIRAVEERHIKKFKQKK